jgi:hypothetical protein
MRSNKNVDIKLSAHDAFLESPSSGTFKVENLENQIIYKFLGSIKRKDLNRIAKIGSGHLCMMEEIMSILACVLIYACMELVWSIRVSFGNKM